MKGQSALEMESLENRWLELRSLMQSLGEKISGVNDRVDQIMTNPNTTETPEPVPSYTEEPSNEEQFLEFQTPIDLASSDILEQEEEAPSWEVVDAMDSNTDYEIRPEIEESDYSTNGASEDSIIPSPEHTPQGTNGDVSTVGNVKVGLELLKKGRVALEQVISQVIAADWFCILFRIMVSRIITLFVLWISLSRFWRWIRGMFGVWGTVEIRF